MPGLISARSTPLTQHATGSIIQYSGFDIFAGSGITASSC
jgi:hypothetical protein